MAEYGPTPADVVELVRGILLSPAAENRFPPELDAVPGLRELHAHLWAVRSLALALARGELGRDVIQRGFVVGALKELQADLRHLTWQTQCVAAGQFQHRVNFLGDFSTAFNTMTERLQHTVSELERQSAFDFLTGLPNRGAFEERARAALKSDVCRDRRSTLIMGDIDFFKRINDTYGHVCGDAVLCAFAAALRAGLRPGDLCCRYGGEEFLILLPGADAMTGGAVAERLRRAVENTPVVWDGRVIRVTASFGVCPVGGHADETHGGDALRDLIQAADCCLYLAKRQGRNQVVSEGRDEPSAGTAPTA